MTTAVQCSLSAASTLPVMMETDEMLNDDACLPKLKTFLLSDLKVLIVEDENIIAWDLEELLHEFGVANVLSAASLKQAREALAAHDDINLVLLDLKLQDGHGDELVSELKEKNIPLIVLTGYSPGGSFDFPILSKPYSTQSLLEAIKRALAAPFS
jgi:DNA-binding NtrC family response regulator